MQDVNPETPNRYEVVMRGASVGKDIIFNVRSVRFTKTLVIADVEKEDGSTEEMKFRLETGLGYGKHRQTKGRMYLIRFKFECVDPLAEHTR